MFNIWHPLDSDLTVKIADFQKTHCFEHIEASKITADECNVCPFPGYSFIRLTYSSQRVYVNPAGRQERRYELTDGTISYLLIKLDVEGRLIDVISLQSNSDNLYAINKQLGLKLTPETVAAYLVFFGLVVEGPEGAFYFITNVNHIQTIRDHLLEASKQTLDGMIHASFDIGEGGELRLKIKEKSYPLLGKAFLLTVPVIYAGGAYKSEVRISESGTPTMDNDDPTTIRGLDERLPITKRYSLDLAPDLANVINKTKKIIWSKITFIQASLLLVQLTSILLLPAYLMSLTIVFYSGLNNTTVHQYYEELKSLRLLDWTNLIFGILLMIGVIMRFVVMEVAAIVEKLVPGPLQQFFYGMTQALKKQQAALGDVRLMLLSTSEFMAGAFLALNLFIYGLSNSVTLPMVSSDMNFIETFLLILLSVPVVGPVLIWVFEIADKVGLYRIYHDSLLMYLSSAVISTITFGWLIRLFRMSRSSN